MSYNNLRTFLFLYVAVDHPVQNQTLDQIQKLKLYDHEVLYTM